MADALSGRTVAILATDGVEQVELTGPRDAIEQAGGQVEVVSLESGEIQAMNGDIDKGDRFPVDREVSQVSARDYDGLVLPGGTINPDQLRRNGTAVAFVRDFVTAGKPVGAICHGPWTLVEADVVKGRQLTSFPSIRTDIRNAGGDVTDQEVVVDDNLVTSRNPKDLPAFQEAVIKAIASS
ncbi:type 1 glutamine amidotransferase domain-containing protein [Saccharopolyspora mangrovi]|uniref:Type 1 glutamine amidotransferase domain-containing protein n=1 Tax=Saccharopolyspora mangrovi TaxID=3082379 RepID=A0ABU6AL07_9PSEU|nr:type 1 glutamine amidotransferase domain-containing protein [Saccharopolyspora sp. S2-29]MEB3372216.1 type 1 glutamine amidotransferase domain-containing protein [Saccharopolyspora sp. S2-29]